MERKRSSPMAPAFMVSAPGKPAVAAAISLRSYLLVTTLSLSQRTVQLNFRDIGLNHTWNIDALPWHIFHHPSKKNQRKMHVRSATASLYLFLFLGSPSSPGFIYTLQSTIPIGAGLGSSASVCVCLSAALLLQVQSLPGPHPDRPPEEAEVQIERINRWAFVGESCIHGDPSGVDNTVSAGGKAVLFQRNPSGTGPSSVTPLTNFPKLPLLLVDTQQVRSTATQVEKVRGLKDTQPLMTELILGGIGKLTTCALDHISSADFVGDGASDALQRLRTLIGMNHGFLVALGVSHPRLERIRELVDYADIGRTKLTGAGGGGCAITLFRQDVESEAIKYETILGAYGVGVLWPAVFRIGADGKGASEEIVQEKFENADGLEGIEQLVGVGVREDRAGWKFWTRAAV
ncbi:mevalonate kinase [Podospora didyma]|uniref:Mevalonate kinase n=1 Tax=Podospora didyma TaxID=330526 RepID=A0AAE0K2G5_9PEZI|nr:mevalonate kinase [Podospora didyma]